MDTTNLHPAEVDPDVIGAPETAEERAERLRREAIIIAQAHADIEAGLGVEDDMLESWLDRLERDANTPLPEPTGIARPI